MQLFARPPVPVVQPFEDQDVVERHAQIWQAHNATLPPGAIHLDGVRANARKVPQTVMVCFEATNSELPRSSVGRQSPDAGQFPVSTLCRLSSTSTFRRQQCEDASISISTSLPSRTVRPILFRNSRSRRRRRSFRNRQCIQNLRWNLSAHRRTWAYRKYTAEFARPLSMSARPLLYF